MGAADDSVDRLSCCGLFLAVDNCDGCDNCEGCDNCDGCCNCGRGPPRKRLLVLIGGDAVGSNDLCATNGDGWALEPPPPEYDAIGGTMELQVDAATLGGSRR